MADIKKFGTFGGVFTPSLLTILGVIMYLRIGWVTGHAGLTGIIAIIVIAHLISITTGLSISSIATDKKVGAGGVYYVLSRSLGLPIGGALGITLFLATSLSIALYLVGFAEIFNEYTKIGYVLNDAGVYVQPADMTNSYRLTGSIALLVLTIIAFISTSIAIKTQYIILTAIVLSLLSIFFGDASNLATETVAVVSNENVSMAALFAIFFPAVTGFTAGVAMSGDLKDPKKAIPFGTMGSIAVGFIIYLALGIFLAVMVAPDVLINNGKVLFDYAAIGLLVYFGVWGATLSSALGGILGGPRILQAMSVDKLTPKVFAAGVGAGNEPRNALILTVIIAECGILIGDLNVIAEVVSMFYLAAYGFINLSFFLESWASSDFKPTFKVNKWFGLIGFVVTFIIMSQLNLLAMVAAFIIIIGIYFYLSRKQITLGTGDIWQSVWATIVKKGLKRMDANKDHKRNWKPNTLLFSTDQRQRSKMIEFSKAISGQSGIITNFDLHENPEAKVLFPKSKEVVKDEELENHGIFGRKLEVQNIFKGIESIACTFGFSGIEPNTVLMDWPGQTKDPIWFTEMTAKLIDLDYNVLYLDYDERLGFRRKEKIDLWWRGVGNNAELMLSLAKFITASPDWSRASIRILLVNDTNVDFKVVENRIRNVVEQFRVKAEIRVVNNEVDQKPIYDLMKLHSSEADLVFVGIPEINENERDDFVMRTNNLVSVIGTTLLVKASSHFDETDLKLEQINLQSKEREIEENALVELSHFASQISPIKKLDQELHLSANHLMKLAIQPIENYHQTLFSKVTKGMDNFLASIQTKESKIEVHAALQTVLNDIRVFYKDAIDHQLPVVFEQFDVEWRAYLDTKEELVAYADKKIQFAPDMRGEMAQLVTDEHISRKVLFRDSIQKYWLSVGLRNDFEALNEFGYQNLILLHQSKNILHQVIWELLANIEKEGIVQQDIEASKIKINSALERFNAEALQLATNFYSGIRNKERSALNDLAEVFLAKDYRVVLSQKYPLLSTGELQHFRKESIAYPTYFYRNLILFTHHLQSDLYLLAFSTKIQGLTDQILDYTDENYLKKIHQNINDIKGQLVEFTAKIERSEDQKILGSAIRISQELFFNSEYVIAKLLAGINEFNSAIPSEVELMTAKSINGIREEQGKALITEKIALKEITDYLTRTHFVDPIHERIQVFYDQLKRITGLIMGAANNLQKGIDTYAHSHDKQVLIEAISKDTETIEELENEVDNIGLGFTTELFDRQELLRKELDVNHIIEQVENLRQYVKQQKRRNVLLDKFQEVNKKATRKVGSLLSYLVQKKQDRTAFEYKSKYADIISEQGKLSEFMTTIGSQTDLPFYYEQLFTGTHYSDSKTIENRRFELNRIEAAIKEIRSGVKGAIVISGQAGSGKTYLAMHIASQSLTGSLYKIVPPIQRTWTTEDLTSAMQRATGINDSIQTILKKMPPQSTLVFEDLEQWWLKAEGGDVLINALASLIKNNDANHFFILTSNAHAYRLICRTTVIQNAVLKTIILAPLNDRQIREVIWTRHQVGGLRIRFDAEKETHLSIRKLNNYLGKFHTSSQGNVGLALQQWVNSATDQIDNALLMRKPIVYDFPAIKDPTWKNILYQLFIHHNLSVEEIERIYGDAEDEQLSEILNNMINTQLVEQNERGEFQLKKTVKPYLENWLHGTGFIN